MASESSESPPPMRVRSSTFQFEMDYSKSKDLPNGVRICSPTFSAGGYDWFLEYYPQGVDEQVQGCHASLYLVLASEANNITTSFTFEQLSKKGKFVTIYGSVQHTFACYDDYRGYSNFIVRDDIEKTYCVNNILVISCNIRVMTEPSLADVHSGGLSDHIEKLWKKGERFDVTFEIEGESISAHRFMLAARSPVFEANLFGPMAEAKMECIKIDEMKAEVFKALLRFIYTDQLPVDDSTDVKNVVQFLQGLLAAADRYGLDKLTGMCEMQLERNLSVETVATTLLLADRHSRTSLKQKCLDFASAPENFLLVALTEGYLNELAGVPELLAELSEKVKASSHLILQRMQGTCL